MNFSDHASRIIHPLVRVLQNGNNELRVAALDTLCSFVIQLGPEFAIFLPTIAKVKFKLAFSLIITDVYLVSISSQYSASKI